MTYSIVIGGTQEAPLATISGWKEFKRWANRQEGDELLHLVQHGWCQHLTELETQLRAALEENPPKKPGVREIANGLLETLKARDASAVSAFVTDGQVTDDVEIDDDDWVVTE